MNNNLFFNVVKWKFTKSLIESSHNLLAEFNQFSQEEYTCAEKYYTTSNVKSKGCEGIPFIIKGIYHYENINQCPTVKSLIEALPIYDTCSFSVLNADARILPHKGFSDHHIRVHLGIKTDGLAWIRVGNQVQHWHNQQVLMFNDWEEHEVHNPSSNNRVVFLFDIEKKSYFDNLIE